MIKVIVVASIVSTLISLLGMYFIYKMLFKFIDTFFDRETEYLKKFMTDFAKELRDIYEKRR